MPRKDTKEYRVYMREYMKAKRQKLTGINKLVKNLRPNEWWAILDLNQ